MAMYPHTEKGFRVDEERTLLSEEAPTHEDRHNLPTHVQRDGSEEGQLKPGNPLTSASRTAWQRFNGHGRRPIGFFRSLKAVALSSCAFILIVMIFLEIHFRPQDLNLMLVLIPLAWISHFRQWGQKRTFACSYHP